VTPSQGRNTVSYQWNSVKTDAGFRTLVTGGPEALLDAWTNGHTPRLSSEQMSELAALVDAGPNRQADGVVRWRRIDLKMVIKKRFGVDFHERYVGTLLKKLGFSHVSARPRHPGQDVETIAAFKKTSPKR
jgi:transposase